MAILTTQIIDDIQQAFPSCSDADALRFINRTLGDFLQRAQSDMGSDSLSVTQSNSLAYLSNVVKVQDVVYQTDSSTRKKLNPNTTDDWDKSRPGWRDPNNVQTGTPYEFALESVEVNGSVQIGIYMNPAPDTTTSAGYPKLLVSGHKYTALTTGTTSFIPTWMTNPDFLVNGACYRCAKDRGDARMQDFYQLYVTARGEQLRAFSAQNADMPDKIDFFWFRGDQSV